MQLRPDSHNRRYGMAAHGAKRTADLAYDSAPRFGLVRHPTLTPVLPESGMKFGARSIIFRRGKLREIKRADCRVSLKSSLIRGVCGYAAVPDCNRQTLRTWWLRRPPHGRPSSSLQDRARCSVGYIVQYRASSPHARSCGAHVAPCFKGFIAMRDEFDRDKRDDLPLVMQKLQSLKGLSRSKLLPSRAVIAASTP